MNDLADPIAGHASIGDLSIQTDSLNDLRWDRVMPILIEEQVFMCHQMRQSVETLRAKRRRGLSVLDLGTGSGIFGIHLDHELNRTGDGLPLSEGERSSVLCLDINPRAIRFVEENAKPNGAIRLTTKCERYSVQSVPPGSQDVVIINPPYHPVHGHWVEDVALHGAAGEDGLAVFREWKDTIAVHLRAGGLLVGSVMSPTTPTGEVVAMEELADALGRDTSSVHFCRHLDEPDPSAGGFLRRVYAAHLDKEPDLAEWIEQMERRISGFTVVYFEAEKATRQQPGVHEDLIRCHHYEEITWKDRIHVHALMARKTRRDSRPDSAPCGNNGAL
jgi:methylase of polypeptide subunit release factors